MGKDVDPILHIFEMYEWDYDTYLQLVKYNSFDSVHPLNPGASKFGGMHVRKWGRFGNSMTQLSNLVSIVQKYPIPVVYFEEQHPFFGIARLTETTGVPFIYR